VFGGVGVGTERSLSVAVKCTEQQWWRQLLLPRKWLSVGERRACRKIWKWNSTVGFKPRANSCARSDVHANGKRKLKC